MRNDAQLFPANVFTSFRQASAHPGAGDALVSAVFAGASALAAPLAALDELLRPARTKRVRAQLFRAHEGRTSGSHELASIWFTRIAREGLRILLALGFAGAVLRRVEIASDGRTRGGNCVYAIYHTPWGRVLALWLGRQPNGVLFSARRWLDRAGKAHVPCTWRGLRELVVRIREGSSAAVTADHFGNAGSHTTAVTLLARDVQMSTGIARIAVAANVPIVPVITRYRAGRLQIALGSEIDVQPLTVADATRRMTAVFDAELRRDPSGWEHTHRFLSRAPDRG
ncbi:MAG: hypothetical protein H0W42_05155 [Gemmatimonadaceae bacterium]|nr:hypothetical protein [Gemmatimonadaceae bacterium]